MDDRTRPPTSAVVVPPDGPPLERWSDAGPGAVSWRTLLSADRTPSTTMTVGVAEVEPGDPGRVHLHRHDPAEVYHVLAGEGSVVVDGVEHPVAPGSTLFVPAGAWHSARNTGTTVLRILYVLAADSFDEVVYEFADPPG